ncbi:MAG: hypothetical protein ACKOEC_05650 [Acidimicrobiia bacterium]
MTSEKGDPGAGFPVLVDVQGGLFRLRIKELALVVRGPDLDLAYDELKRRRLELIDWAKTANAMDELPSAAPIAISPVRWSKAKSP